MPKPTAAQTWERDPFDWYVEPRRCTVQLAGAETFSGDVHDPCCGQGHIVESLARIVPGVVTGSDIVQRVAEPWHLGVSDFLDPAGGGLFGAANCVMNSPFYRAKGAEDCIRRALALAPGKVCAFVDARFLQGSGRAKGLFASDPPNRTWVVTPRPSCPPGQYLLDGGTAGNGTSDFLWLVWDEAGRRLRPGVLGHVGWLT